ncbi:putative glyoxalase [Roseibium sp. TrichSKD4]|uniref:VOC family protein n=1 Tax=Roseibium sp. TrichSKD4 TaxID=744980 RepID=UPI0001E56140|nr:VOC family protein [Roseibium sp. TrichSKD4]EFO33706.1 putative glyoxalase [Roseibium sp. TrichSKD4]
MARGLDHIVQVVKDLDKTAEAYEELGFTVTPTNHHDWGTSNRLVQLDGFFIEILAVRDESLIAEHANTSFSFGAYNRNFLRKREGAAMLVLDSKNPVQDQADFKRLGLTTYDPFSFERIANLKDGSTAKVGFDLTFTSTDIAPALGFFTCHNRYPDTFWRTEFQTHPNGAKSIEEIVFVADDPSDLHEFLGGFTGQRLMRATSLGLEMKTARGTIRVLTAAAYQGLYSADAPELDLSSGPQIAAMRIGGLPNAEISEESNAMIGGMRILLTK